MSRIASAVHSAINAAKAALSHKAVQHDVLLFAGFFTATGVLVSGHLTVDALTSALVVAGRRTLVAVAAQLAAHKGA